MRSESCDGVNHGKRGIKVLPIEKIKCEVLEFETGLVCSKDKKFNQGPNYRNSIKKKRKTVTVNKVNTVLLTKKSECEIDDVMDKM